MRKGKKREKHLPTASWSTYTRKHRYGNRTRKGTAIHRVRTLHNLPEIKEGKQY